MNESREKIYPCRLNYSVTAYCFFHVTEKARERDEEEEEEERRGRGEKREKNIEQLSRVD